MQRECVILGALCGVVLVAQSGTTATNLQGGIVHKSGLHVVPIYEGWYKNPDDSLSLSFGYLNLNYEEELDIPVGPANRIEPAPADQGQPTHFYPRRQRGMFVVRLPKDAGSKKITWTLSARGQTATVPANLGVLYTIDALQSEGRGQVPPGLKLDAAGPIGVGPGGVRRTTKTVLPNPVSLDAWVAHSTGPGRGDAGAAAPRRVTLTWSVYRGPGTVMFSHRTLVVNAGDRATTTATFREPGEYVLRVLAMGGEMDPTLQTNQCCWTNGYVDVSVQRGIP
jgi:hypothetical protein